MTDTSCSQADMDIPRPSLDESVPDDADPRQSLTLQPFGATEQQVSHEGHMHESIHDVPLAEVDHLDLNAPHDPDDVKSQEGGIAAPTAVLASPRRRMSGLDKEEVPNPLEAGPGEDTSLPIRNFRLKALHRDSGDVELPKVKRGEHDGPTVQYSDGIVLDAAGYHKKYDNDEPTREPASPIASAFPPRPKSPVGVKNAEVQGFINDLMGSEDHGLASPQAGPNDDGLPSSMAALSLEGGGSSRARTPSPVATFRRGDRMTSEPPELSRPVSPNGGTDGNVDTSMDLAWDWGKIQEEGDHTRQPHRAESLPVGDHTGVHEHRSRAELKEVEYGPYEFLLELDGREHVFELSLCGDDKFAPDGEATDDEREAFDRERVSFQKFMEDANIVDDPRLVVYYNDMYLSWATGYHLLFALAIYRRASLDGSKPNAAAPPQPQRSSGYWSRWWRGSRTDSLEPPSIERTQSANAGLSGAKDKDVKAFKLDEVHQPSASMPVSEAASPLATPGTPVEAGSDGEEPEVAAGEQKHYAKTLRLSSDQLKELHLKPGPNTINFSVMSSYSGYAVVSARIFLWDESDQVIISDIDGTITKSDALGHVFAAIGRDWTHVGIANLYTDICNNGYKILYLTARAIGQADTTRDYLKTVVQGDYRLPEGPVIMSPDRLMASLHREVILRKPELFKMACLRDIQRLFGQHAKTAFFAGFGNRITDAMSYRSVGIETGKIYTIDSTGVIKTELLQASHKGSYIGLNDLVNEVFPPVKTKFQPEYTDFNYWRDPIMDIAIPDIVVPVSPALSARSDTSGGSRLSYLGKIASLGRRSSRPILPDSEGGAASPASQTSRPSSPLIGPALTPGDLSEDEEWASSSQRAGNRSRASSMPGSFEDGNAFPESWFNRGESMDSLGRERHEGEVDDEQGQEDDSFADDDAIFDDDILATGEMARVPF